MKHLAIIVVASFVVTAGMACKKDAAPEQAANQHKVYDKNLDGPSAGPEVVVNQDVVSDQNKISTFMKDKVVLPSGVDGSSKQADTNPASGPASGPASAPAPAAAPK